MIVDLHTRIWTSPAQLGESVAEQFRRRRTEPWEQTTGSAEQHAQAMDPVGVAAVLGFESTLLGAKIDHEQVANEITAHPGSRVGFAGIDPNAGHPVRSLEEALNAGLVGVTVCPAAAGFHPTDTRAMELFEACQSHGVPVHVESSGRLARQARLEFDQPVLLDEVAREFPDLKLVIGSLGDPWVDQGVALLAKHPTVYADLAGLVSQPWRLLSSLLSAFHHQVIDQVLFASNFPFCDPAQAIKNMYSVNTVTQGTNLPSVPREQLRSIVERDTLTVLGIPKPDAPAAEPKAPAEATESDETPPEPADTSAYEVVEDPAR
ncbi:MAG: amidohydrolase family protein [Planctomycetota bacterium]